MEAKYLAYRLAQRLSESMPSGTSFRFAEWVAAGHQAVSWRDRATVRTNLSIILEVQHPPRRLVGEVFRNFGRYLVEFFTAHRVTRPDVRVEGYEHLEAAQRAHRGVILLTGHLGNWELAGIVIRRMMGVPLSVVALPHADWRMNRLFNGQRERCGLNVIPLGLEAARQSLRRLRSGAFLGLLGDRDFTGNGLRLSLCGRDVPLPRGPATLSLRAHAPIIPTFLIRKGPWRFTLCFESPIWPKTDDLKGGSIRQLTQAYAVVLERYVKRFPEQWLVFQPLGRPARL